MKWLRNFLLIVGTLAISASCSSTSIGHVVDKSINGSCGYEILVIQGIDKNDIEQKSDKELLEIAQSNNLGTWFYVEENIYESVKTGDRIKVWYQSGGPVQTSDPPHIGASKVEILE